MKVFQFENSRPAIRNGYQPFGAVSVLGNPGSTADAGGCSAGVSCFQVIGCWYVDRRESVGYDAEQ